ncbi:hypothetical protein JIG36_17450 [Actinoplanes sp. LDG1-06]|uniref:PKD domain-containing protein n=1 Tax=Paractinoplanes ovalisporus TaxID=2810368 RepID=A0ABS2AC18_9ACTN|nr:PKD domain-containing protein [Actinoplanes ovalisporus]MBM2617343.1 hypothetical protein [Actinoplanes ovalisporus]
MKLVHRRALPVLFTAALTAGVVGVGAPAFAAGEAPVGAYDLDSNAIWTGQTVTLTQTALTDDDTEAAAISRVINWGDGTAAQTAEAGTTSWTHTYAAAGSYTVAVTLNDGTVEGPGTLTPAAVGVTAAPGNLGWQKNLIYTNTYQGTDGAEHDYTVEGVFTPTGLPTTADEAWVAWGDSEHTLLAQQETSVTVPHYFGHGTFNPQVQLENEQGKATARNASTLTVNYDRTAPRVAVKFPASPNKASSWTTVRGTASDSQAGVDYVSLLTFKWKDGAGMYIYNFDTKSWIRYTGQPLSALPSGVEDRAPVTSSGTWASRSVAGLSKGWHLELWPMAIDKVANWSSEEYYVPVWLSS